MGGFRWVGSDQDRERRGVGYFERELEHAVGLFGAAHYWWEFLNIRAVSASPGGSGKDKRHGGDETCMYVQYFVKMIY